MAATKYQVLYRYMNENMNVAITNDQSSTYEEVCEFYTDPDHRIFSEDIVAQTEELEKQQQIITNANKADNPKNDMLFVYNGTEKIPHKKYIEKQTGYVVKHWELISRSEIGDRGDFTKNYTTIGAATPEDGGTVVCTQKVFESKCPATTILTSSGIYTSLQLSEMLDNSTIFKLKDEDWRSHATESPYRAAYSERYNGGTFVGNLYTGKVYVDGAEKYIKSGYDYYDLVTGSTDGNNTFTDIKYTRDDIETIEIEGHYEDTPENPYLVKDTYKRIEMSPWLINCTTGSLTAALEKAKKIIDMIGIENVKIIKLVEIDQFIKIK